MRKIPLFCMLIATLFLSITEADTTKIVAPLQDVNPGTRISDSLAARWNRLVLLATPAVSSGAVERIPVAVQGSVARFSAAIMATVLPIDADPGGDQTASSPHYVLGEVGVGCSAGSNDRQVIVTADTASQMGIELGFLDRRVLTRFEAQLRERKLVARTKTMAMFDAPALMSRAGGHQDETIRHLIWVNPRTGVTAMAIWLVDDKRPIEDRDPIQYLQQGTRLTRPLHVDGSEFRLGMPTQRSFALERLPKGRSVQWTEALCDSAARSSYTSETLAELTSALREALLVSQSEPQLDAFVRGTAVSPR